MLCKICGTQETDNPDGICDDCKFCIINDKCEICKNQIAYIEDAHIDHIERFSEGGKTTRVNGRLTHRYCNLERG